MCAVIVNLYTMAIIRDRSVPVLPELLTAVEENGKRMRVRAGENIRT